ncbi:MAG TPA: 2OG-Fe(II) oxygenase [Terriglobia bacterium]|nr:2OG-Fe(II) oxygenase [Terriglobia bacterium]
MVLLPVRRSAAYRVIRQTSTVPDFDRKIVSAPSFLYDASFQRLRIAAERQVWAKRVNIPIHKRGETISYHELYQSAPEITAFYLSAELHDWCSSVVGSRVQPTPPDDLSSCSLLIYDRENDHIGWHYDINFYRGRHFTALLSLVNTDAAGLGLSSAQLSIRNETGDVVVPTAPNTMVLFEGAFVFHSVSRLREGERRIILSMTFCTDPAANAVQNLMRRSKDIAYFGLRALWT